MTESIELQKKLKTFIGLSLFILVIELVGGYYTNSLALLSDAGHVLIDVLALVLAYTATILAQRIATKKFTYGYHRAEIFSALINSMVLIGVTIYIAYESYSRFLNPESIKGIEMLVISIIGLVANMYVLFKMHGDEKNNMNVKGAYLHVLTDTLSSVGVIIAGGLIIITGNTIYDPIISVIIAIIIFFSSIRLLKSAISVFMEATPEGIDMLKVQADIEKMSGVQSVHDLHIWSISSEYRALSAHISVNVSTTSEANNIIKEINHMLEHNYNITHTTIQSGCDDCENIKHTITHHKKHEH